MNQDNLVQISKIIESQKNMDCNTPNNQDESVDPDPEKFKNEIKEKVYIKVKEEMKKYFENEIVDCCVNSLVNDFKSNSGRQTADFISTIENELTGDLQYNYIYIS